ncbi:hypothetical protein FAZ78_05050 [Cereibacter changlensis]|uniref:DUF2231 domain-containing protein n=1 Tax=Cereibacter changlensis TaxID=402884 RepID=A0A4U0YXQ0_9RHOB|nr:DUF2231 domain-containing protein [Cereibacter changlensis]TKA97612.1 hypothetical protein FAZ78_05050 [Cereibacter changlensis]
MITREAPALDFSASPSGYVRFVHPLHAVLLAFVFPLFLGTLAADIAYWRSAEIQWTNFAQWLNAGGLLVGGFALLAALVSLVRHRKFAIRRPAVYFVVLLAAWIVGFVNALVHSKDAWAIMPEALWWSGAAALLALVATWLGYAGFPAEEKH